MGAELACTSSAMEEVCYNYPKAGHRWGGPVERAAAGLSARLRVGFVVDAASILRRFPRQDLSIHGF